MRIFIACRETQAEVKRARKAAEALRDAGHEVWSTWIYEDLVTDHRNGDDQEQAASTDFRDLAKSDCVLTITPKRYFGALDQCKPVIFGAGLAFGKRLVLIGPTNSAFHFLPIVEVYADIETFIEHLKNEE